MPVITRSGGGKVTAIWGGAQIRDENGKMQPLHVGDLVKNGDVILTTQNGIVRIADEADPVAAAKTTEPSDTDRVIAGLNQGDLDIAPGAGLVGGDGGSLSEGFRVGRITEGVTPASMGLPQYEESTLDDLPNEIRAEVVPPVEPPPPPPPVPVASVSVSPASVNEDGETNLVYTVTLDRAPVVDTVVELSWSGTATAGTDFADTRPASITVLAGELTGSTTVTIDPTADTIDELDETVIATITSGTGYTIGTASATGTILDNDTVTVASVTSDTEEEGTALVHTVTLSGAADRELSFAYTLGGGTATVTSDYTTPPTFSNGVTLVGGNLIIPTGVTSFTITTATVDDALDETSELYNLSVGGVAATGTITDNDVPVASVSVNPASVDEAGSISLVYTVTLDRAPVVNTVVKLLWSGTATADTDFTGTRPATITVLAGQTTGSTTVTIVPTLDSDDELDETVIATIESGPGYTIGMASATGTIVDAPLITADGLRAEYYGYNDLDAFNAGMLIDGYQAHTDDKINGNPVAENWGPVGNLTWVENVENIISGRSKADGSHQPDATFLAQSINFGVLGQPLPYDPVSGKIGDLMPWGTYDVSRYLAVTDSIGTNAEVAPDTEISQGNLYEFVGTSGTELTATHGGLTTDPASGLGLTTDAAIRFSGQAYFKAGLYDVRVFADDGFQLRIDGQTVAQFDNIQQPTARVFEGIGFTGGLTPFELLYWEQGQNAVLRIELKAHGAADSAYQVLGSSAVPLFSDAGLQLTDLQDLVQGTIAGTYVVRTGLELDGDDTANSLTGTAARDALMGFGGGDDLKGGDGSDRINGGQGDDILTGGTGRDVFEWNFGDEGTTQAPAHDVIKDFINDDYSGDVLDLRDLLDGGSHPANVTTVPTGINGDTQVTITSNVGNLADFLNFSTDGGDTVIKISSKGNFTTNDHTDVDQVITLAGINLVGSFTNDNQVINDLLARGKLITDVA